MNFIIVYPPASVNANSPTAFIPMGGLYLAESLIKNGYSASIADNSVPDIKKQLEEQFTDDTLAIGISSMSGLQLRNAVTVAQFVRERFPRVPIVWGGAHATALPEQTLEHPLADFVVKGEGEEVLLSLLDAIKNGGSFSDIAGAGYKHAGGSVMNANSGYTHLDRTFDLPYHLIDMDRYARDMKIGLKRCYPIYTSRGCPFRCTFCSNPSTNWSNRVMRYHTYEHTLNEISVLVNEYGADGITIADELPFVHEERMVELCTKLQEANFGIKYRTTARVDMLLRLSPKTWDLMLETGFIAIGSGIETGSERMLKRIKKDLTLQQIYELDEILTQHKLFKSFNFMACIPGETVHDVSETLSLVVALARTSKYCPVPFSNLSNFVPLPETELFNEAIEAGYQPPKSLEGWTDMEGWMAAEDEADDSEDSDEYQRKFQEGTEVHFGPGIPCIHMDRDGFEAEEEKPGSPLRPWIDAELDTYVKEANHAIIELNNAFTGDLSNEPLMDESIAKLEDIAERGRGRGRTDAEMVA